VFKVIYNKKLKHFNNFNYINSVSEVDVGNLIEADEEFETLNIDTNEALEDLRIFFK